jgi:hypothetical protein
MNKTIQQRIAALQKEQEQLKAREQSLRDKFDAKEKSTNERKKFVIGAIVLKDIEDNTALRKHIANLLSKSPERDKKLFPDLLPPPAASTTN